MLSQDSRSLAGKQISANNSTPLRYSKKTRYWAITQVQIPSRIGCYKSTQVILNRSFKTLLLQFVLLQFGFGLFIDKRMNTTIGSSLLLVGTIYIE